MPTFKTDIVTKAAITPPVVSAGAGVVVAQQGIVAVPITHAANDIVQLNILPKGCVVVDFKLASAELDTHGTDTLAYTVGVLNSTADGVVTNTNLITAGKMEVAKVQGINSILGLKNIGVDTVDRVIALKIDTVAATKAAGDLIGILEYRSA
jgi:hypothetical protein